jgi:hypothetical protein
MAWAFDRQELSQPDAGAAYAGLDRANGAIADFSRLSIRVSGGSDEDERLALVDGELIERREEILEIQIIRLLGLCRQQLGVVAVDVFHFAPPLSVFRSERITQNGAQPRWQVCTCLKGVNVGKRAQERLLHKVVCAVDIAAKRHGEGTKPWDRRQHRIVDRGSPACWEGSCSPGLSRWGSNLLTRTRDCPPVLDCDADYGQRCRAWRVVHDH